MKKVFTFDYLHLFHDRPNFRVTSLNFLAPRVPFAQRVHSTLPGSTISKHKSLEYRRYLPLKNWTRANRIGSNNRTRVEKSEAVYDKGCSALKWDGDAVAAEVFGE